MTVFSIYVLLYSLICLSNATMNQKDVFSKMVMSYVSIRLNFKSFISYNQFQNEFTKNSVNERLNS